MPQPNDLSRSLVALDQNSTIIAVIEMSQSSWLVAGVLPGIERQPRKKLEPSPERLLGLLHRWQDEAVRAGRTITRIALAFEAAIPRYSKHGTREPLSHAPQASAPARSRRGRSVFARRCSRKRASRRQNGARRVPQRGAGIGSSR